MAEAKEKPLGFFEVFDMFMKECGEKNAWTVATSKKMDSLRVDLMAFKKNISFENLTDSTLAKFVAYLRNEKKLRTPRKKKADRDDEDTDALNREIKELCQLAGVPSSSTPCPSESRRMLS